MKNIIIRLTIVFTVFLTSATLTGSSSAKNNREAPEKNSRDNDPAVDIGPLDMAFEHITSGNLIILVKDQTYQFRSGKNTAQGVYKKNGCWLAGGSKSDTEKGNYIFYTSSAEECCMLMFEVGPKTVLKRIAGYKYGICFGGVYTRIK